MMRPIYKIMFGVSLGLVIAAGTAFAVWGLQYGVDFSGGSVMELRFTGTVPELNDIRAALTEIPQVADATVAVTGDDGVVIRTATLTEAEHQAVLTAVSEALPDAAPVEQRFDSIGPAIGRELKSKSLTAILLVLIAVVLYIALVFRAMRRVLSPWVMGGAALVALAHDLIIPLGVFAWLGHSAGIQVSAVFVAAILTILGYSVADTVVIFDRVRENILRGMQGTFADIVHASIMQTLVRSLNTTLTTLAALVAIWLFGGATIHYFALALIIGIVSGAYSSIFVASPLLVWMSRRQR